MKRRRHYAGCSPKTVFLRLIVVLVLLLAIITMLCLVNRKDGIAMLHWSAITETTVTKNENSISIPGYEQIEFKANVRNQDVCLNNPLQNSCYFKISLWLENNTLLWESDLIGPGEKSNPIVLAMEMSKGIYPNAVLRYSCYQMDESQTLLNGAETKLTILVK